MAQKNFNSGGNSYQLNKYLYNGKELQDDILGGVSLDWYDYGARFYDPSLGRWHCVDPSAENYLDWTPYNYCANNPMLIVDLDGRDWFYYMAEGDDDAGWHWQDGDEYTHEYTYTNEGGEEQTGSITLQGVNAVAVFDGSFAEKLGTDGTLSGEGANPATVTVYGPDGADDIATYRGLTISSDPSQYATLDAGAYSAKHQQMATSIYGQDATTYRITGQTISTAGYPTSPNWFESSKLYTDGGWKARPGLTQDQYPNMTSVFLHRTNWNGVATSSSHGCLLIDGTQYNNFQNQLGKPSSFLIIVNRPYIPFDQRSSRTGIQVE